VVEFAMPAVTKDDRYSKKTHKHLKRKCYGRYACDGCYVCAGVKTARFSKREVGVLTERIKHESD
jgi:hypothetical protein